MASANLVTSSKELAARIGTEISTLRSEIPTDYVSVTSQSVGNSTTPIYIKNGVVTVCTSSLDDLGNISVTVTASTQTDNVTRVYSVSSYSGSESTGSGSAGKYTYGRVYDNAGVSSGTYTVEELLNDLVDISHYHTYKSTSVSIVNCDCTG